MIIIYLALAIILLVLGGIFLLRLALRLREQTGLPLGEIVYSDTGAEQRVEKPLISRQYGLAGKPDYLLQVQEKGRTVTIPVEVKSRRRPAKPYENHILQLAAYCILVEEQFKVTPPYGLLRYADATLKIPFTDALRRQVLQAAEEIRQAKQANEVARSHNEAARCQQCGYLHACGKQAL